jgi:hypothetical protein
VLKELVMKKAKYLLVTIAQYICIALYAQTGVISNHAFQAGEKISYTVFYNVIGIYINAGTATLTTMNEKMKNNEVYHVIGEGVTNSKYDWIFKVRDRYESYFNTSDLQPLKFCRRVSEGKYNKYEEVTFNQQTNTAITTKGVYGVPENVQDAISIMYYARDINYEQYQKEIKFLLACLLMTRFITCIFITLVGKR